MKSKKVAHLQKISNGEFQTDSSFKGMPEWTSQQMFAESYQTTKEAKNARREYLNSLDYENAQRQRKNIMITWERRDYENTTIHQ